MNNLFLLATLFVFGVAEPHVYLVDDIKGTGRQFDGIGGLSGGGVSSQNNTYFLFFFKFFFYLIRSNGSFISIKYVVEINHYY